MKKIYKKKAIPKHFLGTLLSTGVGLVTSAIQGNAEEKRRKAQEDLQRENIYKQELNKDTIEAENYQKNIENTVSGYYSIGGTIDPPVKTNKKRLAEKNPYTPKSTAYRRFESNKRQLESRTLKGAASIGTVPTRTINNVSPPQAYTPSFTKNNKHIKAKPLAGGGNLDIPTYNTKGGNLKPLSSDMKEADGNKHGETTIDNTSGIKLIKNGKAFAEIEDNETIKDGRMVYSDRLTVDGKQTYADVATRLGKEKGKIEKDLSKGDRITNSTNKRKLELLDRKEDALFIQQENSKKGKKVNSKSIPKAGFGDFLTKTFGKDSGFKEKVGKVGKAITPFIDNIGNALITGNTPKIAAPNLERIKNRKTTVNVNPQLNSVNDAVNSASTSIQNNTSNSNVARGNIAATKLEGAKQKAKILANKENVETQLQNQNQDNIQATSARNLARIDDNNMKQTMRADDIGKRNSANLANLAGDFIDKRNFDEESKLNDTKLKILRESGDKGVTNRAFASVGYNAKVTSNPNLKPVRNVEINDPRKTIGETDKKGKAIPTVTNDTASSFIKTPNLKGNNTLEGKPIETNSSVPSYQQRLKDLGFYKGNVDGISGQKTKEAIKEYQRANGLVDDGIIGKNTLQSLNSK